MSPSAAMPSRRNSTKAAESGGSRVIAWAVYLAFGFFARLWIIGLWIFSDLLGDAFEGWVIPVLGFIFLPWTTLTYAFMWTIGSDKASGWEWIVVAIALLVDLAFWGWSRRVFR